MPLPTVKTRGACHAALLAALLAPSPTFAEAVGLPYENTTLHGELQLAPNANPADGIVLVLHGTLASHQGADLRARRQRNLLDPAPDDPGRLAVAARHRFERLCGTTAQAVDGFDIAAADEGEQFTDHGLGR